MKAFALKIYAPDEGIYYEGDAYSLTLPLYDGSYQVLAGHQEEVGAVAKGFGKAVTSAGEIEFCTNGGVVYVTPKRVELALLHVAKPQDFQAMLDRINETKAKERRKQSYYEHQTGAIALAKAIEKGAGRRETED